MTAETAAFFPESFEDLERFAPEWVLSDAMVKQRKRATSNLATVKRFFDDLYPEIDRIISYLVTVPMDGMSAADKNLYWLVSTWNEMSHPIDLDWDESDVPNVFPFERVKQREFFPVD